MIAARKPRGVNLTQQTLVNGIQLVKLPRSRLAKYLLAQSTTTEVMSRAEIAAWVTSAKDFDDEDDLDTARPATTNTNSDEVNWTEFLDITKTTIMSSRTKRRTNFLNEKLHALATRGGT